MIITLIIHNSIFEKFDNRSDGIFELKPTDILSCFLFWCKQFLNLIKILKV